MEELSERQRRLLKAIVEKYIDTGVPVGSEIIEKEAGLGVSPATIRNEMVSLTKLGLLTQSHTSSGRIPTSQGIKFYVNELMEARDMPVKDEVRVKEELWQKRFEKDLLLKEATRTLADQTGVMSLAATQTGDVYVSGISNILDIPEFYDIDLTKGVLSLIGRFDLIDRIFLQFLSDAPIQIVLGDDLDIEYLTPVGFVFTQIKLGQNLPGSIGVVGPNRLNYPVIIPRVRYIGNLINEISKNW